MTPELTSRSSGADSGTGAENEESPDISDVERLVHGPIARDLLDCMMGCSDSHFDEMPAEIVGISDDPPLVFDVKIEVVCEKPVRVVNSRSLGQYDVDGIEFHSVEPVDDGMLIEVAAEYQDTMFGFQIFVPHEN